MQNYLLGNMAIQYGDAEFKLYFIRQTGNFRAESEDQALPHQHQRYELHIATHGFYDYQIENNTVRLSNGNGLIIAPNTAHNAAIHGFNQYAFRSIFFSLSRIDGQGGFYSYFSRTLKNTVGKPFPLSPDLMQCACSIFNAYAPQDIKSFCILKTNAAAFICALFDCINTFTLDGETAQAEKPNMETLLLLETLVSDSRYTLQDIARQIQYSERHTARLIKNVYQMSLSALRKKNANELPQREASYENKSRSSE